MRILHTSDWHLGRTLYAKKERVEEHTAFLTWLLNTIRTQSIDLLLIAGDVFDTAAPNSTSQKLYYNFLIQVKQAGCDHIVIIGGNHDSPSFLHAPKDVLAALGVTVIGHASDDPADELVVIHNHEGQPQVIICGVPFLRERDISRFVEGENYADRSQRIHVSIRRHYETVAQLAVQKRDSLGLPLPIIATGHLSVAGGKRSDDDGVRDTYIGNIEAVGSDIFPEAFDYVALGHYHIPAVIKEHIRYCGSPIPMGFGEAGQTKRVYVIEFHDGNRQIDTIEIPVFQALETISGDQNHIAERLTTLKALGTSVWVEITYRGDTIFPNLAAWVSEQTAGSSIEVLKVQNRKYLDDLLSKTETHESLEELRPIDVFEKLLDNERIPAEQRAEQLELYQAIVNELHLAD